MKEESLVIHGANKHTEIGEHIYPIYQTSTFIAEDTDQAAARFAGEDKGYKYTRLGNPNADLLAERIAMLEQGDVGKVFSTGMAAISTVMLSLLEKGDHMITDPIIYGCTDSLFRGVIKKFGIEVSFVDTSQLDLVRDSLKENTRVVYLETPANPTLKLVDIAGVTKVIKEYNDEIKVVVDNTFATPIYQKPLTMGADVVVHSLTKYLNGHGDVVMGAAVFSKEIEECLAHMHQDLGTTPSPFDCWLALRGLKTLSVRMEKHTTNAKRVVEFLSSHTKVKKVSYPGYAGMITFELNGDKAEIDKFINNLKLFKITVSLGNVDCLVCHPASTTHAVIPQEHREKVGITDSLIRLSVGIENVDDIVDDLEQALECCCKSVENTKKGNN